MKMEECDGLAAKWNFAPGHCADAQRNDRIAAPTRKTVAAYYRQRQHTSRCDGVPFLKQMSSCARSAVARTHRSYRLGLALSRFGVAGRCGIFATLQNSFPAATVRDKFSSPMSRIYYSSGGVS